MFISMSRLKIGKILEKKFRWEVYQGIKHCIKNPIAFKVLFQKTLIITG